MALGSFLKDFGLEWVWRDSSEFKRASWASSRGPRLDPQNLSDASQMSVSPVPGKPMLSSGL